MWSFLKKSEYVDRIIVARHPMIRFWSAWNQKFLKNQKIGEYICQFTSLALQCDENKSNDTATHLVDFQTFASAFVNENCAKKFGDCNALNVWNEHFARQGIRFNFFQKNFKFIFACRLKVRDRSDDEIEN